MKKIILNPNEDKRIKRGHLWVYRNEFTLDKELEEGEIVDVFNTSGHFVARGFFQKEGSIALRILSKHQDTIDQNFFRKRVLEALQLRQTLYPEETVYRWLHGESDGLPGLVADRYNEVVVAKTNCPFYEKYIQQLAEIFMSFDFINGVQFNIIHKRHIFGNIPEQVLIKLNDIKLYVDIESGQKTGMFLDQRENCYAAMRYVKGKRVLDGYCYIGLWSCLAAKHGATYVLGVDSSEKAIALAQKNALINEVNDICNFSNCDISNIFEEKNCFDVVFLDPPNLVKNPAHKNKAMSHYQAVVRAAIKILPQNGILVASSCSHALNQEDLREVIKRAVRAERKTAKILYKGGAAPDHPVLLSMPETEYLHCLITQIS